MAWICREIARRVWAISRGPLIVALNVLAALIVLFEEWGWRPLYDLVGRLSKYRLWAALERQIASLPPYGALLAFGLPVLVLLPFKFLALYLLAARQFVSATIVFVSAKLIGTAFVARIFVLTKPALMEIPWFRQGYEVFQPWKEALFAKIRASWAWRYGRMVKTRVTHETGRTVRRWWPAVAAQLRWLRENARAAILRLKTKLRGNNIW